MQPNPYQPPQHPQHPQLGAPMGRRPNQDLEMIVPINVAPLALIAGYAGLGAFLCLPAPIALLLGVLALRDLEKRPDRTGKGRAWFGVVTGVVGTLCLLLGVVARLAGW